MLIQNAPLSKIDDFATVNPVISVGGGFPVVRVCLKPSDEATLLPNDRWFQAAIDTGCTHSVLIGDNQLNVLAKRRIESFKDNGPVNVRLADSSIREGRVYDANLWIKASVDGVAPIIIELNRGFTYAKSQGPPIPLIGARALRSGKLVVSIDYANGRFSVLKNRVRFGQWLVRKKVVTPSQLHDAMTNQAGFVEGLKRPLIDQSILAKLMLSICDHSDAGSSIWEMARERGLFSDAIISELFQLPAESAIGKILVRNAAMSDARLTEELGYYHLRHDR